MEPDNCSHRDLQSDVVAPRKWSRIHFFIESSLVGLFVNPATKAELEHM